MSANLVFRNLPDAYRRAGSATVAQSLSTILADGLDVLERHSKRLLQARFIEHLADLDDAERLAALFALVPWPEEDLAEFRHRVKQMARIYLAGAATASALLAVVGAATDSELAAVTLPGHSPGGGALVNDRFTTSGRLHRRAAPAEEFQARVIDLPPVRQELLIGPASGFSWEVENATFDDPGDLVTPPTYPEPVVEIVAGEHPVVVPILLQRDLRRLVLVNRFIPPGAALRVDLRDHTIADLSGPPTLQGPILMGGDPAPDLLYATGGLVDDVRAHWLTDPPERPGAARPFHVLRWNKAYRTGPDIPEVPGPPGSADPVPIANIPWPPLLGMGISRWRLLVGANLQGLLPNLGEQVELNQLRPLPATVATGPASIRFRWVGRRLATFTVILPEEQLCDGPSPAGRMKHRADWLREQIMRLKLAGVLYVEPAATALLPEPAPSVDADPTLSLWEVAPAADALAVTVQGRSRQAKLSEETILTDAVSVTVTKEGE